MNIAEYSIKKSVITITLTIVCIYLGIQSFRGLPRLEDPEFTIKEAIILTPYPGATAAEVEEEVTNVIEKAVQEMGQLKRVESTSSRGLSTVKAVIKDEYDKNGLPQVWDELRRKVNDYQSQLPPGAVRHSSTTITATYTASTSRSRARVIRTPSSRTTPTS
ncbi:MAG: efflux RND transporter permease subunit [Thermodesulfobacteriota bacterium]